jgi:hypothetical protein
MMTDIYGDLGTTRDEMSLRMQMDVWFCRAQEPMPRGTLCA